MMMYRSAQALRSAGAWMSTRLPACPSRVASITFDTTRSLRDRKAVTTSSGVFASGSLPTPSHGSLGTLIAPGAATAIPVGPDGPWPGVTNHPSLPQFAGSFAVHEIGFCWTTIAADLCAGEDVGEAVGDGDAVAPGWPTSPDEPGRRFQPATASTRTAAIAAPILMAE